ncbi:sensor domain-containing diguanylate cyclase [Maridesulfovibrio bastinii]|uniref:sensor domain-containing diguanylate cyclase n=1 Tax=Maridesulfovibrio bastinii TaxID=47157 RepID=UPI000407BD2C|nr:sensor domain-containing diguanylate cyclase [Maridesulfovibrio bastinii]
MKKNQNTIKKQNMLTGEDCTQIHYKHLFISAASAIVVLNEDGRVREVNDAFTHITGYHSKEIVARPLAPILASEDEESLLAISELFSNPGVCSRFKHPFKCKDGRTIWIELTVSSCIESSKCRLTICIFNDITYDYEQFLLKEKRISELQEVKELQEENSAQLAVLLHELDEKNAELETEIKEREKAERLLKESEERFKSLSVTDQLTGLYNRRQLHDVFENEISRSKRYNRPLSIILMDVDDFKKFNDTYGHLAGDSVLNRLGQIIQSSIRETDKGFRYGGEEFLVVLPETSGTDAIITAKRIMQTMEEEKFHPNANTTVIKTLSVGIAEYIPEEFSNNFLKRADDNMYHAKINGKNRISYQHNIIS